MAIKPGIAFCPHCGNLSQQKLVHSEYSSDTGYDTNDGSEQEVMLVYYVAVCGICSGVLVYTGIGAPLPEEMFNFNDLAYPDSGQLHDSVPEAIYDIYKEAARIKRLAPNAFAVTIRRALEALCDDRGEKHGTLEKRLEKLVKKGEIPTTLAEVSDMLRLLGNTGAHAGTGSVKPWQVHTIDEFFRTVVEYVYVGPFRLAQFRTSLQRGEASGSEAAQDLTGSAISEEDNPDT